jgi:hypothetical protein
MRCPVDLCPGPAHSALTRPRAPRAPGFTSRMDKVAIKSAGKTLYYAYGRLLMASTTLGGSVRAPASELRVQHATAVAPAPPPPCLVTEPRDRSMAAGGLTMRELRKFTAPRVMALIAAICFADALYMLSLYQVPPVAPRLCAGE